MRFAKFTTMLLMVVFIFSMLLLSASYYLEKFWELPGAYAGWFMTTLIHYFQIFSFFS